MVAQTSLTIGDALDLLRRETMVVEVVFGNEYIRLPNGWVISVGYSVRHHCENYGPPDSTLQLLDANDCEIAIFRPDNSWFAPHDRSGKQVWKNVSASDLLVVVDAVATYREDGPCPCPDCVRGLA